MFVDTHCHLDFNWFNKDRDEVILNAKKEGVGLIINPGIDIISSQYAVKLAIENPIVYAAVGVHPNDATAWDESTKQKIKYLALNNKVVAIGEIGLDYYRKYSPKELQKKIFLEQLDIARELELPVIIHSRDESIDKTSATADVIEILKDWTRTLKSSSSKIANNPGVLHSYGGELGYAQEAVSMGFFIGVTGPVTFKNADRLRAVVAEIPSENLLIETDAPFLTPHPYRGKRNEPKYVKLIAEKLAEVKELSVDKIEEITLRNAENLFNWKQIT